MNQVRAFGFIETVPWRQEKPAAWSRKANKILNKRHPEGNPTAETLRPCVPVLMTSWQQQQNTLIGFFFYLYFYPLLEKWRYSGSSVWRSKAEKRHDSLKLWGIWTEWGSRGHTTSRHGALFTLLGHKLREFPHSEAGRQDQEVWEYCDWEVCHGVPAGSVWGLGGRAPIFGVI